MQEWSLLFPCDGWYMPLRGHLVIWISPNMGMYDSVDLRVYYILACGCLGMILICTSDSESCGTYVIDVRTACTDVCIAPLD
jgi:hypothetical protein